MKERLVQATLATMLVIVICAAGFSVYATYKLSDLGARVMELEEMMVPITVGVTIDYGGDNIRTETVRIMVGATALDALEKIATVETTYYPTFMTYLIDAIDGIANNPDESKWWMWYIWNPETSEWEHAPVGAGLHTLKDMENIEFRYEMVAW